MLTYQGPTYEMAVRQFDIAADYLQLSQEARVRTRVPKRAMIVSVPIRMDDGHVEVFTGYRVQHNLSLGPDQGRHPLPPDVTLGEVAALAMWMTLEMRAGRPALRRRQGRRHLRSRADVAAASWSG